MLPWRFVVVKQRVQTGVNGINQVANVVVEDRMIECLACRHKNPNGELLCIQCGAPLSDEDVAKPDPQERHPLHQRTKAPWLVALAVLSLAAVIFAFTWNSERRITAQAQAQQLPSGAVMVGGGNLSAIRSNPTLKKWLDFPATQLALNLIKNQSGVDLLALKSATGAVYKINDQAHILGLIRGRFQRAKLEKWIAGHSSGTTEIAGRRFYFVSAVNAELGSQIAPVVVGLVDDENVAVASPELLMRYFNSSTSTVQSETINKLLNRVGDRAVAWGVGQLKEGWESIWWVIAPVLGSNPSVALANLNFVYSLHIEQAIKIQITVTCPNEESAQQIEKILSESSASTAPWAQDSQWVLKVTRNALEVTGGATFKEQGYSPNQRSVRCFSLFCKRSLQWLMTLSSAAH